MTGNLKENKTLGYPGHWTYFFGLWTLDLRLAEAAGGITDMNMRPG
jgi:hypothetical protein